MDRFYRFASTAAFIGKLKICADCWALCNERRYQSRIVGAMDFAAFPLDLEGRKMRKMPDPTKAESSALNSVIVHRIQWK